MVFAGMHATWAVVVGATLSAARSVWSGTAEHGASLAGGLHHPMRARAGGFAVYNDPAIAIAWLLAQGARRVAYVELDAHRGDGVEAAFAGDPRVLIVSLHEQRDLAEAGPSGGAVQQAGAAGGRELSVSVGLPPGTDDSG